MSGKGLPKDHEDVRVKKAVKEVIRTQGLLSVPKAMLANGFTIEESKDRAMQQLVRRQLPKQIPTTQINVSSSPSSDVSSITASQHNHTPNPASSSPNPAFDAPSLLKKPPKAPDKRRSTMDVQDALAHKKRGAEFYKESHKHATGWYGREQKKQKDDSPKKSAKYVSEMTKKAYHGVGPSSRTIIRECDKGRGGKSPLRKGAPGEIPPLVFNLICNAFESFVVINQLNGNGGNNTKKILASKVNAVMNQAGNNSQLSFKLLNRIITATAININASKVHSVEARRILWTTYKNLKVWFENWEKDLLDLGFALKDEEGNTYVPDEQLYNIGNIDETCLSLDGSKGNRGGRPEVVFFDPRFPQLGRGTSKCALTTTMICGSNAAGEAYPPHFQFQTSAKTDEQKKLRNEMLTYLPTIVGKFGCGEVREDWPITIGMNAKGGMDDEEFSKYVTNSLIPLYPNAADVPGKRVMLKVDSGPGRLGAELLARMRLLGFYMYPGVPNTTSVSQETDRNYGPFKTQFRKNLYAVVDARVQKEMSLSFAPWIVGLVVFGGMDPKSLYVIETCAFSVGFSNEQCLNAWAKIGAVPLTRACLDDPKVRREIGDGDAEYDMKMILIQDANDVAVHMLTELGFKSAVLLKGKIKEVKKVQSVTKPNSQERVEALAKSSTHGGKFHCTNGMHVTTDDMFRSMMIPQREKEIADMSEVKKNRLKWRENEQKGQALLASGMESCRYRNDEYQILLAWYQVPNQTIKEQYKYILAKKMWWQRIVRDGVLPPAYQQWTQEDEANFVELSKKEIDMKHTALGRLKEVRARECIASVDSMTDEQRSDLQRKLDALSEAGEPSSTDEGTTNTDSAAQAQSEPV